MKQIKIIIICCLISFSTTAQNYKTITFTNEKNEPIEDVQIFTNKIFVAVSDINGKCEIPDTITKANCIYLGFKDTVVEFGNSLTRNIRLNENATLLKEVEVSTKYDISKHFKKLWKETNKKRNSKDTVVYYSFMIETELYELGQKEVLQGVIKQVYKKGGKGFPFKYNTYLCKINSYYSNIETEIRPVSLMEFHLDNFMYSDLITWLMKHEKFKNLQTLCSNSDSIIFRESYKRQDTIINNDYWGFKRGKNYKEDIYFTEESKGYEIHSYSKDTINRSYEKIKYNSKSSILYPVSIISIYEYASSSNLPKKKKDEIKTVKKLIRREYAETIPNPNLDLDLDINLQIDSPPSMINKVKEKYPDYVIPNKK